LSCTIEISSIKLPLAVKWCLLGIFSIMFLIKTWDVKYVNKGQSVFTYDAFGYYIYLPGTIIYHDIGKYEWLDSINEEYHLLGNHIYQLHDCPNGNKVAKYYLGTALMQLPFFLVADVYCRYSDKYKRDGFSAPYNVSIHIAGLVYMILGLFILAKVLSVYFEAIVVNLTLISIALATNILQYAVFKSGMSHVYLFFLYTLMLYLVIKWNKNPNLNTSIGIGVLIGLVALIRPTDGLIFLIPLLWR